MFNYEDCTLEELWKHVGTHLESKGFSVTLVGGGVATIYSHGDYLSGDLDFVRSFRNSHKEISDALEELDFIKTGRIFVRKGCQFTLDIAGPPVEVGFHNDPDIKEVESEGQKLKILSPTECIKDRLLKTKIYKDEQAMLAAISVAKSQPYEMDKIEKFCNENQLLEVLKEFKRRI